MKKIHALYAKFGSSLLISSVIILLFGLPLLNIAPPLGSFFQPINGVYEHLDDGEIEEYEEISHSSLNKTTTLVRDEFGTPHIFAETIDDLYFAEGYAMAKDRLFEMDILRRFSSGRLAELIPMLSLPGSEEPLDPQTISKIDAHFRYTGLPKVGENLVEDVMELGKQSVEYRTLQRFADGVNFLIGKMKEDGDLPLSYTLLNTEPEPWTMNDTGYVYALITFAMGLKSKDLDFTSLNQSLNPYIEQAGATYENASFNDLFPDTKGALPYEDPIIPNNNSIFPSDASDPEMGDEFLGNMPYTESQFMNSVNYVRDAQEMLFNVLGLDLNKGTLEASNNWVVHGNRTASGKPIVCNDPHLLIIQPSVFYEVHLVLNGTMEKNSRGMRFNMNVHGVTLPGIPSIVIGFNDQLSWGITNFASDSLVDYYYETLNEDGTQYYYEGEWHNIKTDRQTVEVRRGDDLEITIRNTDHGPIITDSAGLGAVGSILDTSNPDEMELGATEMPISMCWAALKEFPEGKNMFTAIHKMMCARNLSEFREGIDHWSVPAMNINYGDKDNNIAMFIPGLHPVRALEGDVDPDKYTGKFIQPGDGTGQEWVGWIPEDQIPYSINPEQGYLASANHRSIAAEDYNYSVGHDWTPGNYRGRRINDVLEDSWNITKEEMGKLQADVHDVSAESFVPPLLEVLNQNEAQLIGDLAEAHEELMYWNETHPAEMRKELIGPTIFRYYLKALEEATWEDEWTESNSSGHYPSIQYLEWMVREDLDNPWFDDINTLSTVENGSEIMLDAFRKGVIHIADNLGNLTTNRSSWIYGHNFKLLLPSFLQAIDLVTGDSVGHPYDGSEYCVDNAVSFGDFPALVYGGPAWRHIIDFGDPAHPLTVIPPGNSGNMFSSHWDDQRYLFVHNQYKIPCREDDLDEFIPAMIERTVVFKNQNEETR